MYDLNLIKTEESVSANCVINGKMSVAIIKHKPKSEKIEITEHAYERAKERFSLNKAALERFANSAYKNGIKQSDTVGQLKKYIAKLWHKYKTANNIRIYGEIIFIFCDNRLITLYHIPNEFKRVLKHFR